MPIPFRALIFLSFSGALSYPPRLFYSYVASGIAYTHLYVAEVGRLAR